MMLKDKICSIGLIIFLMFLMLAGSVWGQHRNVKISGKLNQRDPQEPSIAINPANTNEMVAGSNKDHYFISGDGGETWTHGVLTSPYGVYGDPCLVADDDGSFYFFHLANPPGDAFADRIICQKLSGIDGAWNDGTYAGLNGIKIQDKEWAVVDNQNEMIYVTWTQFDEYGSSDPKHFTNIMFSYSADGGLNWSAALRINEVPGDCRDDDNTVEGAVPTVGPNGEIYVSWAGPVGIVFDKSTNRGKRWLDQDVFVSDNPGGWGQFIPGIYRCNGMPVTACDISKSPYRGHIYINWSDQRNGDQDTDIWLSKSTDGGMTWSAPKRVNDDPPGKQQFFTWMTIDQTNGYIYIIFYDRRNYDNLQTDVYLAVSKDGGESFKNHKISETPFTPNRNVFFGDYTNISAHNNVVRPIWARLDDTELSIWTAIVNTNMIVGIEEHPSSEMQPTEFIIESIYPNPFNAATQIQYYIPAGGEVVIKVFDMLGKEIKTLFEGDQIQGVHHVTWNAENIASGVYFIHIEFEEMLKTKRVVLSK